MNNHEIEKANEFCAHLKKAMDDLLDSIGPISISNKKQMPFGWRKAAKGRTVWRLVEEIVSQNLEVKSKEISLLEFEPAPTEVGVYDFKYKSECGNDVYVNIKSAVKGGRTNKDDISKAIPLYDFVKANSPCFLMVATIELNFVEKEHLGIEFANSYVMPTLWLPDLYVNPSNNGNLQSSKYKSLETAVPRDTDTFMSAMAEQIEIAKQKKEAKRKAAK